MCWRVVHGSDFRQLRNFAGVVDCWYALHEHTVTEIDGPIVSRGTSNNIVIEHALDIYAVWAAMNAEPKRCRSSPATAANVSVAAESWVAITRANSMETATPDASSSAPGASSGKIIDICHWHTGIVMTRYNISSVRLFGPSQRVEDVPEGCCRNCYRHASIKSCSNCTYLRLGSDPVSRSSSTTNRICLVRVWRVANVVNFWIIAWIRVVLIWLRMSASSALGTCSSRSWPGPGSQITRGGDRYKLWGY